MNCAHGGCQTPPEFIVWTIEQGQGSSFRLTDDGRASCRFHLHNLITTVSHLSSMVDRIEP